MNEKALNDYSDAGKVMRKLIDAGHSKAEAIEVLKTGELHAISSTLESINSNLSDISLSLERLDRNLDGCISRYGNDSFLCITGNVSTY